MWCHHNCHQINSLIQMVDVPRELKIWFEDLDCDARRLLKLQFIMSFSSYYKKSFQDMKLHKFWIYEAVVMS